MGQISLPVINKSGVSSYWDTSGDSKYEISLLYAKDFYVRSFITYLMRCNIELRRYVPNQIKDIWYYNVTRIDEIHKEYYLRPSSRKFKLHILDKKYLPFYEEFIVTSLASISSSLNKVLPIYSCKLLILKHNDTLVLVNRYLQIKRGSWEFRCKSRIKKQTNIANSLSKSTKLDKSKYKFIRSLNSYRSNLIF